MATNKPLEEYLAMIPYDRHPVIRSLDDLIRKTVPALKPCLTAGLLGYGPYQYQFVDGHEGDSSIIALGAMKQHFAMYVSAADGDGYVAEQYKKELPAARIVKTCIRFRKLEDLSRPVLRKMLKHAASLGGMGAV